MINIDISEPQNIIIVNVSNGITGNNYTLSITSFYSNKSFDFALGQNHSNTMLRYDSFILDSELLTGVDTGFYVYKVISNAAIMEMGMLKVYKPNEEIIYSTIEEQGVDEFIIYTPE